MKKDLREILLRNKNVDEQIEAIEELYADKSDLEKIKHWRDRYYSMKRVKESIENKYTLTLDKMIKIQKILMEK
jgi:hypothetical protein